MTIVRVSKTRNAKTFKITKIRVDKNTYFHSKNLNYLSQFIPTGNIARKINVYSRLLVHVDQN